MSEATHRTYEFFTYDHVWNKTKEILGLTDEELRDEVKGVLQMQAWGDVMREVLYMNNLDPDNPHSSEQTPKEKEA